MNPELIAHLTVPPGPPWTLAGTGYLYKKQTSNPRGLLKLGVKAVDGIGKVNLKAKAAEVPVMTLPLGTPVVVHLQTQSTCWQARYSTTKLNNGETFKGLADDLP